MSFLSNACCVAAWRDEIKPGALEKLIGEEHGPRLPI